jgi:hypothetical protein
MRGPPKSLSGLARFPSRYQEDFTTPGISPRSASPRKQSRQIPNFRRKARGLPQSWQRLCLRDENFGLRLSLTLFAVVAIDRSLYPFANPSSVRALGPSSCIRVLGDLPERHSQMPQ